MIKVVVKKNGEIIAEKELGEFAISLGHSRDATIYLESDEVSDEHALISMLGDKILIEDSASRTGTYVNGKKVSSTFIEPGDRINIGPFSVSLGRSVGEEEAKLDSKAKLELERETGVRDLQPENVVLKDWLSEKDSREEKRDPNSKKSTKKKKPLKAKKDATLSKQKGGRTAIGEEITEAIRTGKHPKRPTLDRDHPKIDHTAKTGPGTRNQDNTAAGPVFLNPRLYLLSSKAKKIFFTIEKTQTIVGRSHNADLVLEDPSVSSRHALIEKFGNSYSLFDQGSTNGTRVNKELINEKVLKCHDIISFGDVKMEFLEGAVEPVGESASFSFPDPTDPKRKIAAQPPLGKESRISKRIKLYLLSGVLIGLLLFLIFFAQMRSKMRTGTTRGESPTTESIDNSERERIVEHNLNLAKKLIAQKKYEEAKEKLKLITEGVDPQNREASMLISKINGIQEEEDLERKRQAKITKEKLSKIETLISKGKQLFAKRKFSKARAQFEAILKIDAQNKQALKYLNEVAVAEARTEREKKVLKEKLKLIESLYYQGISYYEEGNYDEAAAVLRKVVEFKSTEFYQSAKGILDRIESKQMANIEEQLTEIDSLVKNDELLKAENILRSILKRYPKSSKAGKTFEKVHNDIVEKAKRLYAEALVYERVVDDVESAVENYKEILRLLPNPKEEYHKKAKARLKKLE